MDNLHSFEIQKVLGDKLYKFLILLYLFCNFTHFLAQLKFKSNQFLYFSCMNMHDLLFLGNE